MICPHCKKEITHVSVQSICYQRGSLDEKDGKPYISDYDRLDITDIQAIECPKCNGPLMHIVGDGSPLEDGVITHVDLISAGYEWTCPACLHLNTTEFAATSSTVKCSECDIEFTVDEV